MLTPSGAAFFVALPLWLWYNQNGGEIMDALNSHPSTEEICVHYGYAELKEWHRGFQRERVNSGGDTHAQEVSD